MQPWPKPNHAAKERSSEKEPELRSRLKLAGVGSGVKGRDERQSTAPLTPLPTTTPIFCLDSEDVVRDVKRQFEKYFVTPFGINAKYFGKVTD
jgi:hypothetical protein